MEHSVVSPATRFRGTVDRFHHSAVAATHRGQLIQLQQLIQLRYDACPHVDAKPMLMSTLDNDVWICLCPQVVVVEIHNAIPGKACFVREKKCANEQRVCGTLLHEPLAKCRSCWVIGR